jgi:hypothetical protein
MGDAHPRTSHRRRRRSLLGAAALVATLLTPTPARADSAEGIYVINADGSGATHQ